MPEMAAVCNGKQGENAVFHLCFPQQPAERFASVVVHAEKPSPRLVCAGDGLLFCFALRLVFACAQYIRPVFAAHKPNRPESDLFRRGFRHASQAKKRFVLPLPADFAFTAQIQRKKGKNISRFFAFCSRVYEKELHSSVICPLSLLCPARRCGILRMCRKIRMYRPRQTRKVRFCFF